MAKDLTVGKPSKVLLKLSLPMFVSVIFQQLYNLADSVIAGQFAGESALAAVGASYPITMVFMSIAIGLNIGCSVVISQLFGAKQLENTKTAIATSLLASLVISVVMTLFGVFASGAMMRWINTPADIMPDGTLYLKIYCAGLAFLFVYNAVTAVFTALGDTKTPLIFLIFSSLFNILLDYLLVSPANMGVAGVAWATFIAQGLACVLSLVTLLFSLRKIKTKKYKVFSWEMLGKVAKYAAPSIIQQFSISVGNIFVQSIVNRYGTSVVAGFSAGMKLNAFAMMCIVNMANGMSTFTAQNVGAYRYDRIKQAFRWDVLFMYVVCLPFVLMYCLGGEYMMKLFVSNISPEALSTGMLMMKIISPFYFVVSIKVLCDGVTRGAGAMFMFMSATLIDLILRVGLSFALEPAMGVLAVYWSWPIGWGLGTAISVGFYLSNKWKGKSLAKIDSHTDIVKKERI